MFLCSLYIAAYVVEDSDKMRCETLCLSSLFSRKCDTINQIAPLVAECLANCWCNLTTGGNKRFFFSISFHSNANNLIFFSNK